MRRNNLSSNPLPISQLPIKYQVERLMLQNQERRRERYKLKKLDPIHTPYKPRKPLQLTKTLQHKKKIKLSPLS